MSAGKKVQDQSPQHSHHMCLLPSGPKTLAVSSFSCFMNPSSASPSSVAGAGSSATTVPPEDGAGGALAPLSTGLTHCAMPTTVSSPSSAVSTTTSVVMPSRMRLTVRAARQGVSWSSCDRWRRRRGKRISESESRNARVLTSAMAGASASVAWRRWRGMVGFVVWGLQWFGEAMLQAGWCFRVECNDRSSRWVREVRQN